MIAIPPIVPIIINGIIRFGSFSVEGDVELVDVVEVEVSICPDVVFDSTIVSVEDSIVEVGNTVDTEVVDEV